MSDLWWRRGRAQVGVLAAVLAVMVAGAALIGACVLLTTASPQRALQLAIVRAPAADVQVGVALGFPDDPDDPDVTERVAATARDASGAVADATALLTAPFGDLPATVTTWTSTVMRYLPPDAGPLRLAYLAELDDPDARGTVASGRWPTAAGEVALPTSTARALGLDVGSTTTLAATPGGPGGAPLTVVGTFVPRPGAPWQEDPLDGSGVGENYRGAISAYGPLVVAPGGAVASGIPLLRVTLRVQPDLSGASAVDVTRAGTAVDALRGELDSTLGDRTENVVTDLPFARTLDAARQQRGVTGSGVLAVALLGAALVGTTVVLAARLVAARRAPEAALLAARGMGRSRLVGQAAAEAGVLALLCVVPATALAVALHRVLADAVGLGPADLPEGGLLRLAGVVTAVALTLGVLLVLPWLRTGTPRGTREDRVGVVARSGADLVLLALAAVAFLQLRAHQVATGAVADPVLVVAPVLCLLAGAALALRPLPLLARRADARARTARSLTLPLAAWGAARRPQGAAAAFLVVLATACATFGVGFAATWVRSQGDQAAAAVGTDLVVPARALGTGASLREATNGQVSPVTSRTVTLGSRVQSADEAVHLVAVDTRHADGLLRGRLPAGGWAHTTSGLAPAEAVGGVLLTGTSADLVVSGHVADDVAIDADLSLVVQDADGARAALAAGVVPLDGAPHTVTVAVPQDARVVGVDARLSAFGDAADPDQQSDVPFDLDLTLRDATPASGSTWSVARARGEEYVVAALDHVTATTAPDGVRLTLDGTAYLPGLYWSDGTLTALAFRPVEEVPVVVSARLAGQLGLKVGDGVQLALGLTPVHAKVLGITAYVPSQPRAPALLADVDALSRAALSHGGLDTLTDEWWVGGAPPPGAARTLAAQGLGPVTARAAVAQESADGPLRAPQRAATALLVVAALVLTLVGTALHSTTALEARELDVARLSGLGASRRSVLASLLAEQAIVTGASLLAGAVLGALACWAVGPLLVLSPQGLAPVPAAAVQWPWPAQVAMVLVLVLGCAALVVPLTARAVRRATIARLRMDPVA
ncbi:hypothetical protein Cch01nite_13480 [Cellulomonas chitinilytica]|uniref:ABC3 transporter permease C-terminal domain-containing protein n=1 Tax=Cellulomonas chitinilytica TaxID=398759 RepID=A0A919P3Y0_9CELL|nr:ABC transporter permease [Cellulomonas chitinilytica]GIG20624.1 hypothetical protein Cch01nite_13480 [Cellulomonas chitinilytica]